MKKYISLIPLIFFAFLVSVQSASAAEVGEDLAVEFIGTLTDTRVIPDGNGKIELDTYNGPGTYTMGGDKDKEGSGVAATNAAGDIYITGDFSGTVDFDPTGGTDNHTSNGSYDIFLTKINADKSYGYTYTIGGLAEDNGNAIAINTAGDIYITGAFGDTVNFDTTGTTPADPHTSNGAIDIFITKFNADGTYGYTYTMGGTSSRDSGHGLDIAINAAGDIYITGDFSGTVNFDPTGGTDKHTSMYQPKQFLTKINADKSYGYTYILAGSSRYGGNAIATNVAGDIYITGGFQGTVDFDPTGGTDEHTSNSDDIFITKFNADGTYGYTYTMGGTGYRSRSSGYAIATNVAGDIYITGGFQGTVNFDTTGTTPADPHTSKGRNDIFITKFNANGTYGYTYTMGGSDPRRDNGEGHAIAINVAGDIYITGDFSGTVDFDPTGGIDNHTSSTGRDGFITKINADGSYGHTYTMEVNINAIATNVAGDIYITGGFSGTVNFDPTGGTDNHTAGYFLDIFLTKFNADGSYGSISIPYSATGTYQTLISPPAGITSWGTLSITHDTPTGTTLSYKVLDQTCSIPLMRQTSAPTIDISLISAKDYTQLCLIATFATTNNILAPQIEKWSASFATSSTPPTPTPPPLTTPVYRFWSNSYQAHFYTASEQEKDMIVLKYPQDMWRLEGVVYNAVDKNTPNATPVYRFWSEKYEHHFYTASEAEKAKVIANYPTDTWRYEGVPYYVHSTTTVTSTPVYRFWSEEYKGHFYTASETEKDLVIKKYPEQIWKYEGVAWYVEK